MHPLLLTARNAVTIDVSLLCKNDLQKQQLSKTAAFAVHVRIRFRLNVFWNF